MRDLKRIYSTDYKLDQVQQNIIDFINQFRDVPLLDGIAIKNIELDGSVQVVHKLGRVPQGYIVTKKNGNASVWNGEINERTLDLLASGNIVIDIWVY